MTSRIALKTEIYTRFSEVPAEEWDSVYPDTPEGHYFLKTLDESGFEQFSFYYCLVYKNNSPVAAATFFLMDFQIDMAFQGALRSISKTIKRFTPKLLSFRTLFCGLPMGQGRIGLKAGTDAEKEEIVRAICESMEGIAAKERASILVFKDFNQANSELLGAYFYKQGYSCSKSLPSTSMNIVFDSFEGYLKSLSSSSREGFRRKFKKIENNPPTALEITGCPDEESLCQLYGLYMQTVRRSEIEFEVLPLDFFRNISRNMPDNAKFFLWRMEGRLVAFALCLTKGDYFIDYYLGFDYCVAHQYNLYLVRFRDLMNWCIANKMKTYEMGQANYEVKRRLGFEFLPLFVYSKPRSRLLRPFFRFHHRFLMFENFDPVFKQMQSQPAAAGSSR